MLDKKNIKKNSKKRNAIKKVEESKTLKKNVSFKLLKGMKDVLSQDQIYWEWIIESVQKLMHFYGVAKIDTPILEDARLYEKGTGKTTDIVEKEMYTFIDKSGERVALRPEFTPSFARAYIEHGFLNLVQPVKLYAIGPIFRRENPQAGRYRQHSQINVEYLGSDETVIDAELILLSYSILRDLGLQVQVEINSMGHTECRNEYKKKLIAFYRSKRSKICEDCKRRLGKNVLRLLDCKESACVAIRAEAPQIVDWLCQDCRDRFMRLIEYLDELEIPYKLNPYLVRGMDYYTHTVFEWYRMEKNEGLRSALCGGGRYDNLLEIYSGRETPAVGFGIGVERIVLELKEQGRENPSIQKPVVYIAQLGEQARRKSLSLFEAFRKEGIFAAQNFSKASLKTQLELANKLGVKYVLILGQKEVLEGTILIRDMEGGIQESAALGKVVLEIKKKLNK